MCGIVITTDTEQAKKLVKLNQTRGSHSYSIFYIKRDTYKLFMAHKALGEIQDYQVEIPDGCLAIIHQQAPTTTAKTLESVHPSSIHDSHLWHNGIIKQHACDQFRKKLGVDDVWDTALFHKAIIAGNNLSDIDGSFACVNFIENKSIYIFRNEIAPFFTDGKSFSSAAFDGAAPLPANYVFKMLFYKEPNIEEYSIQLDPVNTFRTYVNPYYFGE